MKCTLTLLQVGMTNWSNLAKAWAKDFLIHSNNASLSKITPALQRTLPLLTDPTSVPFVCRYRADVIDPLSTKQVHQLSDYLQVYNSLESLRNKILPHLQQGVEEGESTTRDKKDTGKENRSGNEELILRVQTSISKSELEDIYAPFKPPSKGSLEDRIREEYPDLVTEIDELWVQLLLLNQTEDTDNMQMKRKKKNSLKPHDSAVILLANRIASHLPVMDAAIKFCKFHCRIQVKQQKSKSKSSSSSSTKKRKANDQVDDSDKYQAYFDFESKFSYLKDHQVLAIRRGVDRKVLKLGFEMDSSHAESIIYKALFSSSASSSLFRDHDRLIREAIQNAWTRLIRKRCTSRLWKVHCGLAEDQSIDVFCDNLYKALLVPPFYTSNSGSDGSSNTSAVQSILALDPGFQAGIKCVILNSNGQVVENSLQAVKFMGNDNIQKRGREHMVDLLKRTKEQTEMERSDQRGNQQNHNVCVVLGNGHGTREAKELIQSAAIDANIDIDVHLVSEAGASVWSVTEMANEEFPNEKPAAVAAVSIGRRFLNPLNELVKIPPMSLGLGMYQHDLSKVVLDTKLTATSIDAVAEVGVDVNTCSMEILKKVPSLTPALCERIKKKRPLQNRSDLLDITGLGTKTFENCAAFVRVTQGSEPLDATHVHPESYTMARWLLKELKWELGNPKSIISNEGSKSNDCVSEAVSKAATRFICSEDQVLFVIDDLKSSIMNLDPREKGQSRMSTTEIGSPTGCSTLSSQMMTSVDALQKACPVRKITATIRNVVDFGAFVDFGGENDGLLHISKLGKIPLSSLLVGQEIGIDILGVSSAGSSKRISVGLTGLNLPAENMNSRKRPNNGIQKKSSQIKQQRKRHGRQ